MTKPRKGTDGWREGKGQVGIDGNRDVGFARQHNVSPWNSNPKGNFGNAGHGIDGNEGVGILRNKMPDEDWRSEGFIGATRDVWNDVEGQSSDDGNRAVRSRDSD